MRSLFGNLHPPSSFSPLSGRPPGRASGSTSLVWLLVCVVAGLLQAASLAWPLRSWSPPGLVPGEPSGWLQLGSLTLLVLALQRAPRVHHAAWRGWLFATSWLVGTFWWLFVSMHTYGGLPAWLAVLAVLALAGALALYYGLATGLLAAWAPRSRLLQALLFAALWTLAELMRGQWLTGFPWGAGGYAQVDLMAVWAPWAGVYGMGALAALLAYAFASVLMGAWHVARAWLTRPVQHPGRRPPPPAAAASWRMVDGSATLRKLAALGVAVALTFGVLMAERWLPQGQRDTAGVGTLRVWLLQGNIAQDEKFVAGTGMAQALSWYPRQVAEAVRAAQGGAGSAPQLVVAPETALPLLPQQLGHAFWQALLGQLAQPGVAQPVSALLGLPLGSYSQGYTNSVWGLSPEAAARVGAEMARGSQAAATQEAVHLPPGSFYQYDKHHLVPFGEFIPPLARWFIDLMHIPLGDFSRGARVQPPWVLAGQRIAPNICYEDLFGEELAAAFRHPDDAPTLLVNLSNIAWFGDTVAIDQHLHISRLRALELGRPMLRATNTGATAVIDHHGVVTHQLPRLTRGRLEASVEGRRGTTPYARWASRWGLTPLWVGCLTLVLLIASTRRRGHRRRRG